MTFLIWLFALAILMVLGAVFIRSLKRPQDETEENEEELSEWTCPTCGFRVQMGTVCIYCGEKKPVP